MAKFYGEIGYSESEETSPGIWEDVITERKYSGDILRNTSRMQESEKFNEDLTIRNRLSIVADPFAYEMFYAMRYIRWLGVLWKITSVEVQRPRLILTIGGVYNE
jgi:hypothetical protein